MKSRMWLTVLMTVFGALVCGGFTPPGYEEVTTKGQESIGAYDRCGEGQKSSSKCVPYHRCDPDTKTIITDPNEVNKNGYGLIDIRFGENLCEHVLDVCCQVSGQSVSTPPSPISTQSPPPNLSVCGIRNSNGVDFKITGNSNEAEYGEFPWMVAMVKKNYNPLIDKALSDCGGSLISPSVVLTGAHCVNKKSANQIKIRAGEWDTQTDKERLPYQERDVAEIIIHEGYQEKILHNDVALLILDRPFDKAEHIGTICLPDQGEVVNSKECFATGWGKGNFGNEFKYQAILKKIELPTVGHQQCEALLRQTRLGQGFVLHDSFMCAGGEEGKDTCTGDGGSPLVCPDPKNPQRYVQVGIVAWGIGCGTRVPGVYVDVGKFRNWIDMQMKRLNFSPKPYTV